MTTLLTVNDKSTMVLTVAFFDEDDVAVIPSAATYRIDDVTSGTAIKASTAISSLNTTVDLVITSAQNASLSRALEERVVTIEFDYGASRHGTDEYRYLVKNLAGVSTP